VTVVAAGPNAVCFDAQRDGKYGFYIVLENKGGSAPAPPSTRTKPHVAVIVDTAPPTMQIHRARPFISPGGQTQVRLNVSLIEENLGEGGTRVFYRAGADTGWQDGGPVVFADGIINWTPPPDIAPKCDLRLVATDLAGNQAHDEIRDVPMTSPPADPPTTTTRTAPAPAATAWPDRLEDPTIPPVEPGTVEPIPLVTLDEQPEPAPTTRPSPDADQRSQLLREQAARYLAQGRLALAGARLQDALELAPTDPDLLVHLGGVLYRTRQYDEATRRFRSALEAAPDHPGAIEGLALVAATQNRYPQARAHLKHLLRLSPQCARHWVHYGDIEHMLGNTKEACAAWEKALEVEPTDETIREKAEKRLRLFRQTPTDAE